MANNKRFPGKRNRQRGSRGAKRGHIYRTPALHITGSSIATAARTAMALEFFEGRMAFHQQTARRNLTQRTRVAHPSINQPQLRNTPVERRAIHPSANQQIPRRTLNERLGGRRFHHKPPHHNLRIIHPRNAIREAPPARRDDSSEPQNNEEHFSYQLQPMDDIGEASPARRDESSGPYNSGERHSNQSLPRNRDKFHRRREPRTEE